MAVEGIAHDLGVAVAGFIEDFEHLLLVADIFAFLEFFRREEVVPLGVLGLLHRLVELELRYLAVSFVGDILDLELLSLLHVEGHAGGVLDDGIVGHDDVDLHVGVSFLLEIVFDGLDGGSFHVLGERSAAAGAGLEFLLQVVALAVLDAGVIPRNDAGTLLDVETEPGRVTAGAEGIDIEAYVRCGALEPDPLDGGGDIVAGDGHLVAGMQAQDGKKLTLSQILDTRYPDAAHHVGLRIVVVYLHRLHNRILGIRRECGKCQDGGQER